MACNSAVDSKRSIVERNRPPEAVESLSRAAGPSTTRRQNGLILLQGRGLEMASGGLGMASTSSPHPYCCNPGTLGIDCGEISTISGQRGIPDTTITLESSCPKSLSDFSTNRAEEYDSEFMDEKEYEECRLDHCYGHGLDEEMNDAEIEEFEELILEKAVVAMGETAAAKQLCIDLVSHGANSQEEIDRRVATIPRWVDSDEGSDEELAMDRKQKIRDRLEEIKKRKRKRMKESESKIEG